LYIPKEQNKSISTRSSVITMNKQNIEISGIKKCKASFYVHYTLTTFVCYATSMVTDSFNYYTNATI